MNRWLVPLLFALAASVHATPMSATTPSVDLHGHRFSIEVAATEAAREHGLMARTTLAADHGMLFVFAQAAPQAFWMKNTLIPLDILYFDDSLQLVSMQLDVRPCRADPCPIYPSNGPAKYVLELAAGTARRIGVKTGDRLAVHGTIGIAH